MSHCSKHPQHTLPFNPHVSPKSKMCLWHQGLGRDHGKRLFIGAALYQAGSRVSLGLVLS